MESIQVTGSIRFKQDELSISHEEDLDEKTKRNGNKCTNAVQILNLVLIILIRSGFYSII